MHNDLPVKEIDRVLESASMEDHSDADCIVVAGEEHDHNDTKLGLLCFAFRASASYELSISI